LAPVHRLDINPPNQNSYLHQDSTDLSEETACNAKIFTTARLLQQDIQRTISRFQNHLEAHAGFLAHVSSRKERGLWAPSGSKLRWEDLNKKIKMLQLRLTSSRKRADSILSIVSRPSHPEVLNTQLNSKVLFNVLQI
jgi:hypothetical protein